jgi:hypothetical protein
LAESLKVARRRRAGIGWMEIARQIPYPRNLPWLLRLGGNTKS